MSGHLISLPKILSLVYLYFWGLFLEKIRCSSINFCAISYILSSFSIWLFMALAQLNEFIQTGLHPLAQNRKVWTYLWLQDILREHLSKNLQQTLIKDSCGPGSVPGLEDTTMRMTYSLPPRGSQSNCESRKINTWTEKPRDNMGTKILFIYK